MGKPLRELQPVEGGGKAFSTADGKQWTRRASLSHSHMNSGLGGVNLTRTQAWKFNDFLGTLDSQRLGKRRKCPWDGSHLSLALTLIPPSDHKPHSVWRKTLWKEGKLYEGRHYCNIMPFVSRILRSTEVIDDQDKQPFPVGLNASGLPSEASSHQNCWAEPRTGGHLIPHPPTLAAIWSCCAGEKEAAAGDCSHVCRTKWGNETQIVSLLILIEYKLLWKASAWKVANGQTIWINKSIKHFPEHLSFLLPVLAQVTNHHHPSTCRIIMHAIAIRDVQNLCDWSKGHLQLSEPWN